MKKTALILIAFFFYSFLPAQLIPAKNSFQTDMAKVIADYPNHFKNFIGELLVKNPQSTDYKSLLNLEGAEECTVTKYSATGKEVYSWQALMLKTEDFDEAEKKFRSIYNSLNNLSVHINSTKIIFRSDFEKPAEEKKFTAIIFSPVDNDKLKIRVELLLQAEMMEWAIKVLVYEKEKKDNERGPVKEN